MERNTPAVHSKGRSATLQTGLSREELLSGLSRELPKAVDQRMRFPFDFCRAVVERTDA